MELSLTNKLRIGAVMAMGVVLIGVLAWPLANQSDPLAAVQATNMSLEGIVILMAMALGIGLAGYFVSWPHGREIGILAVPTGLAAWALHSGSMASLIQANPTLEQRMMVFSALKWEGFIWLGVVAAGFAGVLVAHKLTSKLLPTKQADPTPTAYMNIAVAVAGSALIAYILISRLAMDVPAIGGPDANQGSAVGQPPIGQIVFAVLLAFGVAAFMVKSLLDINYIWPALASTLVTALAVSLSIKQNALEHFADTWPAAFFPNTSLTILPIQMVSFGVLGSIAGYWMAVRYCHWCRHELQ